MINATRKGFTLVELVMVIVIIGLLAAVVVPKFGDMRSEATNAAETATVSAVRTGIKLVYMTNLAKGLDEYPSKLDDAANDVASETNPLFGNVLEEGITDSNWKKTGSRSYRYLPTGNRYRYDRTTGKFERR